MSRIYLIDEMETEDLVREWRHWDKQIQGNILSLHEMSDCVEFRRDCADELKRRGYKIDDFSNNSIS